MEATVGHSLGFIILSIEIWIGKEEKLLSNALDVLRWRRGCKRGRMRRSQGSVVLVVVVIAINRLAFLDYLFLSCKSFVLVFSVYCQSSRLFAVHF